LKRKVLKRKVLQWEPLMHLCHSQVSTWNRIQFFWGFLQANKESFSLKIPFFLTFCSISLIYEISPKIPYILIIFAIPAPVWKSQQMAGACSFYPTSQRMYKWICISMLYKPNAFKLDV
jgi:hypothetical protein